MSEPPWRSGISELLDAMKCIKIAPLNVLVGRQLQVALWNSVYLVYESFR